MQGILQEPAVSVVITDVIETEKRQNDGRTCKIPAALQNGQPQTISGGGVVYNSERGILARLPRNSPPSPNVPFPHPYVSFQTLMPCKAMALRGFLMSIGGGLKTGVKKAFA